MSGAGRGAGAARPGKVSPRGGGVRGGCREPPGAAAGERTWAGVPAGAGGRPCASRGRAGGVGGPGETLREPGEDRGAELAGTARFGPLPTRETRAPRLTPELC